MREILQRMTSFNEFTIEVFGERHTAQGSGSATLFAAATRCMAAPRCLALRDVGDDTILNKPPDQWPKVRAVWAGRTASDSGSVL